MRVAELSRRSGVSVATIKYYLREGLLPSGELTKPNQAEYSETHVHRLRLIRALGEVGGLSIASIGEVLSAVDDPDRPVYSVLGAVQHGITNPPKTNVDPEIRASAEKLVRDMVLRKGWEFNMDGPVYEQVVEVLAGLQSFGLFQTGAELDTYADAALQVAELDVRAVLAKEELNAVLEGVVAGTVLGEALLAGLRRMAHEHVSARYVDRGQPTG